MTPTDAAHTRWWETFEAVFGPPFLAAIALQLLAPLALPITALARIPAGAALLLLGLVVIVRSRQDLARHRQPTDPGQPTSRLVTTGIFGRSRNPLYLGGVLLLVGIALVANLVWGLLLLIPALIACHIILIRPEERYLAAKFGPEYAAYAAAVPRWLGLRRRAV